MTYHQKTLHKFAGSIATSLITLMWLTPQANASDALTGTVREIAISNISDSSQYAGGYDSNAVSYGVNLLVELPLLNDAIGFDFANVRNITLKDDKGKNIWTAGQDYLKNHPDEQSEWKPAKNSFQVKRLNYAKDKKSLLIGFNSMGLPSLGARQMNLSFDIDVIYPSTTVTSLPSTKVKLVDDTSFSIGDETFKIAMIMQLKSTSQGKDVLETLVQIASAFKIEKIIAKVKTQGQQETYAVEITDEYKHNQLRLKGHLLDQDVELNISGFKPMKKKASAMVPISLDLSTEASQNTKAH